MTHSRDTRRKALQKPKKETLKELKSIIKQKHNITISNKQANALIRSADETTKET